MIQKGTLWHGSTDHQHRLNGRRDIVIYHIFQDGGCPPFLICEAGASIPMGQGDMSPPIFMKRGHQW